MKRIAILSALIACVALPARADIVAQIAAHVPSQTHSYAQMMAALQELHLTDRVYCTSIGVTRQGRHIAMAVVADPDYDPRQLRKLLIMGRMHGNEPAGTEASLALLRHMAFAEGPAERALMRNLALLVVPMLNPDGAERSQRRNAAGVDLNRDWQARSQLETQAIERVFHEWRPDAIIDMHELPARSSNPIYQENFIETIGAHPSLPASMGLNCGRTSAQVSVWMGRYGIPLNAYYNSPASNRALSHRHFGFNHHVPAFLFESKTGGGRSLRDRALFHILGMLVVANQVAYHHDRTPEQSIQMAARPQPEPQDAEAPAPEPEPRRTLVALREPVSDSRQEGSKLLRADIEGCEDFAYVTFELDGQVLVLSNRKPYEYSLDLERCGEGPVEIAVRAYDESGRCIASDSRTMTLVRPSAALGQ